MSTIQRSNGTQSTPTRDVTDERSYRRYVVGLLVLSLVLQTVAIAAPGWLTWSSTAESYGQISIFTTPFVYPEIVRPITYSRFTVRPCETVMELKNSTKNKFLETLLREIIGLLLTWLLTLVSAVVLGYNSEKRNFLIHAWFVLAAVLAVTGTIMGELIYLYLVRVDYNIRVVKTLSTDQKIGFPYCLFFYAIACVLQFGSVVLMFKCHHDEVEKMKGRNNGTNLDMRHQEVVTGIDGNQQHDFLYYPPVAYVNPAHTESRLNE